MLSSLQRKGNLCPSLPDIPTIWFSGTELPENMYTARQFTYMTETVMAILKNGILRCREAYVLRTEMAFTVR